MKWVLKSFLRIVLFISGVSITLRSVVYTLTYDVGLSGLVWVLLGLALMTLGWWFPAMKDVHND